MVRFVPFILCILLAIVSGIVLALGFQAIEQNAHLRDEAVKISCEGLLDEPPGATQQIEMSDFAVSPKIATLDFDGDGKWDEVYACAFPSTKKQPSKNYFAVIIDVGNVTNQEELDAVFESKILSAFYWAKKQTISDHTYAALARKYKSMDFRRCVTLHANYSPPSDELGEMFILAGKGGIALSGILFVLTLLYKLIKRILPKRKHDFDEEPEETTNRAGLPSM